MHNLRPLFLEVDINSIHESLSHEVVSALLNLVGSLGKNSQVLCHFALLNSADNSLFKSLSKLVELLILINLSTVLETTGPCKDGSNRVG